MRNTNAPSTAGQLRLKNHPAFHVVLVYDKYADGIRAKEFIDGLVLINAVVKRSPTQSLTKE